MKRFWKILIFLILIFINNKNRVMDKIDITTPNTIIKCHCGYRCYKNQLHYDEKTGYYLCPNCKEHIELKMI
jgi:hypothetical protein